MGRTGRRLRIHRMTTNISKKPRLTREEQETIIVCSAADSEWIISTADPRFVRYLERQGYEPELDGQFSGCVGCRVPFRKVRIRKRRDLRPERKAELAKRFKTTPKNWTVPEDESQKTTLGMGSDC